MTPSVANPQELSSIAHAFKRTVRDNVVRVRGPGQKLSDNSLAVWIGFDGDIRVHSHRGQDPIQCKDYVRAMVGLPSWQEIRQARRLGKIKENRVRENARRKAKRAAGRKIPLRTRRPWEQLGISERTWYRPIPSCQGTFFP
jgi:hypothetical protein